MNGEKARRRQGGSTLKERLTELRTTQQLLEISGGSFTKWVEHQLGDKTKHHNYNQGVNPQITD